jgi:hypothetical protein
MGSWGELFAEQALLGLVVGFLLRALSQCVSEPGIERREKCRRRGLRAKSSRESFLIGGCQRSGDLFYGLRPDGNFFLWFSEDVSCICRYYVKTGRSFETPFPRVKSRLIGDNKYDSEARPRCMKGFHVFRKGVHRIPTLALYRSLLKLSSHPSLDTELSRRVGQKVRLEFRKNRKCYSPRLVKGFLIQAFDVPRSIDIPNLDPFKN